MAITARLARAWIPGVVTGLLLLGPATGGLAAAASAASHAPSVTASDGNPSIPSPGTNNFLLGVSCTSLANCWAVGQYQSKGTQLNQALRWNGRRWSQAATPDPGFTTLGAVSCPLPVSCWAVGTYDSRNGELNEALHWNGRKWSQAPIPSPGGTVRGLSYSELKGVRCTSPGDCWAVGDYTTRAGDLPFLTQALHWNGRRWSQVPTPSPGATANGDRSELKDVRCASPGDCWAVGDSLTVSGGGTHLTLALHWNGRKWSQVATPDPDGTGQGANNVLSGVACAAPRNCWAVGSFGFIGSITGPPMGVVVNLVLHWDGRQWFQAATPNPAGTGDLSDNELRDVTCTAPASCWAVGSFGTGGTPPVLSQALHWNGRRWALVPTPDPAGTASGDVNVPLSIRCTSAANCWAVGNRSAPNGSTSLNLALHWNGTRWTAG